MQSRRYFTVVQQCTKWVDSALKAFRGTWFIQCLWSFLDPDRAIEMCFYSLTFYPSCRVAVPYLVVRALMCYLWWRWHRAVHFPTTTSSEICHKFLLVITYFCIRNYVSQWQVLDWGDVVMPKVLQERYNSSCGTNSFSCNCTYTVVYTNTKLSVNWRTTTYIEQSA